MAINIQPIRRMLDRLQTDPHVQAMIARNAFTSVAVSTKVLDLNCRSQAHCHEIAVQWCEAMSEGRWRRRVVERERYARHDRLYFEFEFDGDRKAFDDWCRARRW